MWLSARNGGSNFPDTWLSLTGTVAHFGPYYADGAKFEIFIIPFTFCCHNGHLLLSNILPQFCVSIKPGTRQHKAS
jgi:hypothetical protein